MMRAAIVGMMLAGSALAQPASVAPWMTGQRLLDLVAFPPAPGRSEVALHVDEQSAKLYIHGVHDATEGKGWCYGRPYKPKPAVLEQTAIDGIKGLPPDELQRNAADLLVEIWRGQYPCPASKDRR